MSPGEDRSKLVLVAGASRAGTTMLDLMLGNNRQSFSAGEVYARFRPFRRGHAHPRCSCGREPCPVWERLADIPAHDFHRLASDRLSVKAIVDSSKRLSWLVDAHRWAEERMEVIDVLIWKEPRDLAYSYWKRSGDIRHWRPAFVSYHGRYLGLNWPFLSVRHDELVRDSKDTLQTMARTMSLPHADGQERFWEGEHHHLFGSRGVQEQVDRGASAIGLADFPPEFESAWNAIAAEVQEDEDVQRIRSRLAAHDVCRARPEATISPGRRFRRPPWYYRDRAGLAYRRFFPRP